MLTILLIRKHASLLYYYATASRVYITNGKNMHLFFYHSLFVQVDGGWGEKRFYFGFQATKKEYVKWFVKCVSPPVALGYYWICYHHCGAEVCFSDRPSVVAGEFRSLNKWLRIDAWINYWLISTPRPPLGCKHILHRVLALCGRR